MPDDFPSFPQMYEATDAERSEALALQASLPSDYTQPADALGDDAWAELVRSDAANLGAAAEADFRFRWDWEMTPSQRAAALADIALQREMNAFIDKASGMAAKPPVDPVEFAAGVRARRAERARRI
jgi:hypothetical protein